MKLIIFGATGGSGLALIEQGIAAGHEVTAFSRRAFETSGSGAEAGPLGSVTRGARVIIGDVLDATAVADAVRGQDAVLSCLGTRPWKYVPICSRGIATIIPAMHAAGIKRIVAMSSIGVGEPKASWIVRLGGATVLRREFHDKLAMENLLAQTDLDWIAVRPGFLTSGKAKGTWRAADDGSLGNGAISRADTAAFMLQQLTNDEWLRRRPVIVW